MSYMNGTVKSFNKRKGYGFINTNNGESVFFHYSELKMDGFKTINPDQKVNFELIESEKGLRAVNICIENN